MDLSVVISTYNRAASLLRTLETLAAQQVPPDLEWEIVVVDNNSRDATRGTVEAFAARAPMPVTYLFEGRQGLSWARNRGIVHAQGDIVAFTDDDILPAPDWVAMNYKLMGESDADIIGGRILLDWPASVPRWLEGNALLQGNLGGMEYDRRKRLERENGTPQVWGGNMAVRRDALKRLGLFDTARGRQGTRLYGGEDVEMIRRALAAGACVVYDPRLVVRHQIHPDRLRRRFFLQWYFDGGEGETLSQAVTAGRRLFGAPLFRYRLAATALGQWLAALVRRRPETLERAMDLAYALGCLRGYWKRRFGRRGHP